MALDKAKKKWCLDQAVEITKSYAGSVKKEQSPEIILKKCYDTLLKLLEDAETVAPQS